MFDVFRLNFGFDYNIFFSSEILLCNLMADWRSVCLSVWVRGRSFGAIPLINSLITSIPNRNSFSARQLQSFYLIQFLFDCAEWLLVCLSLPFFICIALSLSDRNIRVNWPLNYWNSLHLKNFTQHQCQPISAGCCGWLFFLLIKCKWICLLSISFCLMVTFN